MWDRHRSQILERVTALEVAASAVTAQRLTEAERDAAHAAAHKLAGTLGMFNLDRGSDLARNLEAAYVAESPTHHAAASGRRLASLAAELRTMIENRKAGIETRQAGTESPTSSS